MKDIQKSQKFLVQELGAFLSNSSLIRESSSDFDLFSSLNVTKMTFKSAAVLVPITFENKEPMVVLTKRAKTLKEHSGQIAFPGGKVEKEDACEMETAIRESFEEINLGSLDINILGMLPKHLTITGYSISPFVAIIKNVKKMRPTPSEVSEIFQIPLEFLINKNNMQMQDLNFNGPKRYYFAIPYGPYYIWGATARIIKTLSDLIEKMHE